MLVFGIAHPLQWAVESMDLLWYSGRVSFCGTAAMPSTPLLWQTSMNNTTPALRRNPAKSPLSAAGAIALLEAHGWKTGEHSQEPIRFALVHHLFEAVDPLVRASAYELPAHVRPFWDMDWAAGNEDRFPILNEAAAAAVPVEWLQYFVDRGEDPLYVEPTMGYSPLHSLCLSNPRFAPKPAMVDFFARQKADFNQRDHYGTTPLMNAVQFHFGIPLVDALVGHGADPALVNLDGDRDAVVTRVGAATLLDRVPTDNPATARALIRKLALLGADPAFNEPGFFGIQHDPDLFLGDAGEVDEWFAFMVDHGLDPNRQTHLGDHPGTPLHVAIGDALQTGQTHFLEALCRHPGPDPAIKTPKGRSVEAIIATFRSPKATPRQQAVVAAFERGRLSRVAKAFPARSMPRI